MEFCFCFFVKNFNFSFSHSLKSSQDLKIKCPIMLIVRASLESREAQAQYVSYVLLMLDVKTWCEPERFR